MRGIIIPLMALVVISTLFCSAIVHAQPWYPYPGPQPRSAYRGGEVRFPYGDVRWDRYGGAVHFLGGAVRWDNDGTGGVRIRVPWFGMDLEW